ncbi:MAG: hypothetical protein ABSD45_18680 [Terriglobia bacterium]|jgi:hypothetical protein
MLPHLRTAIALVVCGLAFYVSLFLHEDEEARIQDRIEEFWVSVSDRQKLTGSRSAALFNKLAGTVTDAFDRILGSRLVSVQLVGVSSSCAFACLFLTVGLIFAFLLHRLRALPSLPTNLPANIGANLNIVSAFCLAVGLVLLIIAALPSVMPSRFTRLMSVLPALLLTFALFMLVRRHLPFQHQFVLLVALFISTLSDIGLLVGVRQSIRWISEEVRPFKICAAILGQVATGVLVVWAPSEISGHLSVRYGWKLFPEFLMAISVFNVSTAIAALAFVLSLLVVLLHRMFWPIIERLLYPAARYKVVRNHKAMATLGAACVVVAFPSLGGVFAGVLAWLLVVFSGEDAKRG